MRSILAGIIGGGLCILPAALGQGTTVSIGLTYCAPPDAIVSSQPGTGPFSPYYLFVEDHFNGELEYIDGDGYLTNITRAARFFLTTEGRLAGTTGFVSTNETSTSQAFRISPELGRIATSFTRDNGLLRWKNTNFPSGEAMFGVMNNKVVVSFNGNLPSGYRPVSVGMILVIELLNGASISSSTTTSVTATTTAKDTISTQLTSITASTPTSTTIFQSSSTTSGTSTSNILSTTISSVSSVSNVVSTISSASSKSQTLTVISSSSALSVSESTTTSSGSNGVSASSSVLTTATSNTVSSTIQSTSTGPSLPNPTTSRRTTTAVVTDVVPSLSSTSSVTASLTTTTTTTKAATTSPTCPTYPLASSLCPDKDKTSINLGGDGTCYGILCSTNLVGTIITANSTTANSLRACAGFCSLYNIAIPYGCLGVNYLGPVATSGQKNCLLYSKVTQETGAANGTDSVRLVYSAYSTVQRRNWLAPFWNVGSA